MVTGVEPDEKIKYVLYNQNIMGGYMSKSNLIPATAIEKKIFFIRGHKVMFDRDLASLYGVTTFNLNKAVKRNRDRFPADFMFQLNKEEFANLIFHFGISS